MCTSANFELFLIDDGSIVDFNSKEVFNFNKDKRSLDKYLNGSYQISNDGKFIFYRDYKVPNHLYLNKNELDKHFWWVYNIENDQYIEDINHLPVNILIEFNIDILVFEKKIIKNGDYITIKNNVDSIIFQFEQKQLIDYYGSIASSPKGEKLGMHIEINNKIFLYSIDFNTLQLKSFQFQPNDDSKKELTYINENTLIYFINNYIDGYSYNYLYPKEVRSSNFLSWNIENNKTILSEGIFLRALYIVCQDIIFLTEEDIKLPEINFFNIIDENHLGISIEQKYYIINLIDFTVEQKFDFNKNMKLKNVSNINNSFTLMNLEFWDKNMKGQGLRNSKYTLIENNKIKSYGEGYKFKNFIYSSNGNIVFVIGDVNYNQEKLNFIINENNEIIYLDEAIINKLHYEDQNATKWILKNNYM